MERTIKRSKILVGYRSEK